MKNETKYSIVIPAYNAEEKLRMLIENILSLPDLPLLPSVGEIIVADDCSADDTRYLANIYSSSALPIIYLPAEKQEGPLPRIISGLNAATYSIAILLNTDVEFPPDYEVIEKSFGTYQERKILKLCSDPLGYLALCLQKEEILSAISPTILTLEDSNFIHTLSTRYDVETFESYSANQLAYFLPIRKSKFSRYQREVALKNRCLAMKTELTQSLGFDTGFAPHGRWDEDITLRMRIAGNLIRSTTNVVVLHPLVSQKTDGSLASLSSEEVERQNKLFKEKYLEHRNLLYQASTDVEPTEVQDI